jgi:ankyrin repeat protein
MKKNNQFLNAVFRGDINEINVAIDNGFDVNIADSDQRTPLMHASIDDNLNLVKLLLDNGANVNICDMQRMTALHFACQNYNLILCQYLIDSGAKIDAQDDNGNTPLWRAEFESGSRYELQELLIHHGAKPTLKNYHGVSAKDLREIKA